MTRVVLKLYFAMEMKLKKANVGNKIIESNKKPLLKKKGKWSMLKYSCPNDKGDLIRG